MKLYERETWDGQKFLTTDSSEGFPVGMKHGAPDTFKGLVKEFFEGIIGMLDIGLPLVILLMGLNKWDWGCSVCTVVMLFCWYLTIKKLFF